MDDKSRRMAYLEIQIKIFPFGMYTIRRTETAINSPFFTLAKSPIES